MNKITLENMPGSWHDFASWSGIRERIRHEWQRHRAAGDKVGWNEWLHLSEARAIITDLWNNLDPGIQRQYVFDMAAKAHLTYNRCQVMLNEQMIEPHKVDIEIKWDYIDPGIAAARRDPVVDNAMRTIMCWERLVADARAKRPLEETEAAADALLEKEQVR